MMMASANFEMSKYLATESGASLKILWSNREGKSRAKLKTSDYLVTLKFVEGETRPLATAGGPMWRLRMMESN